MIDALSAKDILEKDLENIFSCTSTSLDKLSGSEILITGGGGFLGYELIHAILQIGNGDGRIKPKITVYENFQRGAKPWLIELANTKKINLVEHDIKNPIPKTAPNFSYIVHAASIASPIYYRLFPIETIDANINGIRNILNYSKNCTNKNQIKGILYFSTSEIYGDPTPDAIPTPETYRGLVSCTGPRACYDESKRVGETLCVNFARQYGINVSIARPFNNYGPGLDINDRRLLPDLARNIFNNTDISVLSNGSATRTFCYISDAISGYLKVLTLGERGESYNIGTENPEISVNDFTLKVSNIAKSFFNFKRSIIYETSDDVNYLVDNPNRRCPDISKARQFLGYQPLVNLDEGLLNSLIWYRDNLK
jgi:UDP-glucuronate decarboxylase